MAWRTGKYKVSTPGQNSFIKLAEGTGNDNPVVLVMLTFYFCKLSQEHDGFRVFGDSSKYFLLTKVFPDLTQSPPKKEAGKPCDFPPSALLKFRDQSDAAFVSTP